MPLIDTTKRDRTRELNDAFRRSLNPKLGRLVVTRSVASLPLHVQVHAHAKVRAFDVFTDDNDPHSEHDFGSFELAGHTFFWKIDYYDPNLEFGSEDPADPEKTTRVLTIMLAEEY